MSAAAEAPILTSSELNAISSVYSMCCNKAMADYTEGKRQKIHPGKLVAEREALESCTAQTYAGVRANCAEMMDSYQQCLLDNPRKWKVCNGLRDSLDKCAVQNKLGEIAKM